jgi:hypothetical protein
VNDKIPERKIDEFVTTAFREHGWSQEQALGILFLKNFNFRRAIDLRHTFEPVESVLESFTDDDKNTFYYAYKCHGREFGNIHGLLKRKPLTGNRFLLYPVFPIILPTLAHKSLNIIFRFLENLLIHVFRVDAAQKII